MKTFLPFLVACSVLVVSGDVASPKGMSLTMQTCTSAGNCQTENTGLVADWYLYCTDPRNCRNNPSDYGPYGITINGNSLRLDRNPTGGSRSYLTTGVNSGQYKIFNLLNRELSFDVEMSTMGCGMNAALYFIQMQADGNTAAGYTGALYGTGYCDAQPAQPDRPSCNEMDIWEANSLTTVFTTHPCGGNGCDAWGCSFNPYTRGDKNFYGRGSNFRVDSTRPHTVVTQFITSDGTDNGRLSEVRRYYIQNGQRIDVPSFSGFNSLSDGFCRQFGIPSSQGGIASVSEMTEGLKSMVLSFSLWGSPTDGSQMAWMDNEPNGPCPIYQNQNPTVTFSNIKFGPIGSTN